jgi:lysyl-tRNA synthetase, class II
MNTKNKEHIKHFENQHNSDEIHLSGQEHEVRKQKVQKLEEQHIPAWPAHYDPMPDHAEIVLSEFEQEQNKKIYTLAGRIRAIRKHGKTIFATLQDHTGFLQIYVKKDQLTEQEFTLVDHFIDIGDIIGVTGTSFKTKMGEITLLVTKLSLLSKALRPLPEKFHGLTDTETIYRQRYLDLICNQKSKNRFLKRSEIIKVMRSILDEHGYIEVETPMLHHMYGGAMAKPFVTHHNALHADLYLRIAPELYLKRLIIGGFPRVYEINRNFRNEGVSTKHNPEFTMVEFYTAYVDYETSMNFTESLIKNIVKEVCDDMVVPFGQHTLDFSAPFSKISMFDAVAFRTDRDSKELLSRDLLFTIAKEHGLDYTERFSWGMLLNLLFEHFVEKQLIQPTFVTQFPTDISPLAKKNPNNPLFTDRFELFVAGMELGNGFNELNDPFDQATRFQEQLSQFADSEEKHLFDEEYIQALEYGMPPTSGVGIGIDRLVMFLTNAASIRDVILFPTLKKK